MNSSADLAGHLLSTIPRTMWRIRNEVRIAAKTDLTLPQFRILAHLSIGPSTNGELSEHLGASAANTCRTLVTLVRRGLVAQARSKSDRRLVTVRLTQRGGARFNRIRARAQDQLAIELALIPNKDHETLAAALKILEKVFAS
ncbi:MAG: MarR family transcriptional regulator [Bdellovibrionota bacterium]